MKLATVLAVTGAFGGGGWFGAGEGGSLQRHPQEVQRGGLNSLPQRGSDGRLPVGEGGDQRVARGAAAMNELADLVRREKELSREALGWGYGILSLSLVMGSADDGRLIASTLANPDAEPAMRLAAARVVLYAMAILYPPEPLDEEEAPPGGYRVMIKPFWNSISDANEQLLKSGARAPEGVGDEAAAREIRMAALLAALDAGDEATFKRALAHAGEEHRGNWRAP